MPDLLTWAARAGRGLVLELACPHGGSRVRPRVAGSTPVLVTTCLAEAPVALPVELLARGVARVVVRADTCAEPAPVLDHWVGLADAFDLPLEVVTEVDPDAEGEPVEAVRADALPTIRRRGLFGLRTPDEPAADIVPAGTDHQRLRQALRAVLAGEDPGEGGAAPAASGPGIGLLLSAPDCDLAGVCVQVCPETALAIGHRSDESAVLTLDPGACHGCGTCVAACPSRALQPVGQASWGSLLGDSRAVVADVATRVCERCQVRFRRREDGQLCPVCAQRRAQPFGSVLPEEVRKLLRDRSGPQPR